MTHFLTATVQLQVERDGGFWLFWQSETYSLDVGNSKLFALFISLVCIILTTLLNSR